MLGTIRCILLACAVSLATVSSAFAEQVAWQIPEGFRQVDLPVADAARYAARDVRMSRFEATSSNGLRRVIVSDLPRTGRFVTEPIAQTARHLAANVGAGTCTEHLVSDVREFSIDGRSAADFTLVCRGLIAGGQTMPDQINLRRTVLIQGQSRIYNFQADEYAPQSSAFDAAASATAWDAVINSLAWCDGSAPSCNPR